MKPHRKCSGCGEEERFDEKGRCLGCGMPSEIIDTGERGGAIRSTGRVLGDSVSFVVGATKRAPAVALIFILALVGLAVWNPISSLRDRTGLSGGNRPKIDVVFAIDCTGSMADEIEAVKDNVKKMMANLQSGQPRPDVRFGIVAFRDRGDEFVTRTYPLTGNIDEIKNHVDSLVADGGGDTPESVNEALHKAVQEMNWDGDQKTSRMLFLIGDAGPHMDYANDYSYRDELKEAKKHGIKVYVLGCSGIDDSGGLDQLREIASMGGGRFDYLTYKERYADEHGREFDILRRGSKAYIPKPDVAPTAWRAGADSLAGKKMAEEVSVPSYSSAGGLSVPGVASKAYRAKDKVENNLPDMLEGAVKEEARSRGVEY
jgi:Mg-chelatase subunit ChlD